MSLAYATPGPLTTLDAAQLPALAGLPDDPAGVCAAVAGLIIHPSEAGAGLGDHRHIRPMNRSLDILLALDPAPLHVVRPVERRLVATCRHFATLATALLRAKGVPARARVGFADYFQPGLHVDHWVTEYWDGGGWVRTDPQIGRDVAEGEFLTGGEAWQRFRAGDADPQKFGVGGEPHAWGIGEIRGNAIRDLAALHRIEMLPWDEWGRMADSYAGRTGPDYDELMDQVAEVCLKAEPESVAALYATADLAVPASMIS
ncbi:transglutaminase-like domain-containing protein [Hamadaea tsunoensis]|uniref:transglutaminase-like domain-containing protein n=1 Tax=Hamadaea tsunoensis TaxID=53368 RepID=UPI0004038827|nr:transglutaminase-like domain-containing protein [Hamadaea tsunoensis]